MRADLRVAMKEGRSDEAKAIRTFIAAIDHAEAPPVGTGQGTTVEHDFKSGTAEVSRLDLGAGDVRAILGKEIEEREAAAADFERMGMAERAQALRAEAGLARRYLV